ARHRCPCRPGAPLRRRRHPADRAGAGLRARAAAGGRGTRPPARARRGRGTCRGTAAWPRSRHRAARGAPRAPAVDAAPRRRRRRPAGAAGAVLMFRPLPLWIGLRYLRAKRRTRFISFISAVSIIGIAVGVTALITVISVM